MTNTQDDPTLAPPVPHLAGDLVEVRPLVPGDAADLLDGASDPEVWRWKLVPRPETVADLETLIAGRLIGRTRQGFAVLRRSDGRTVGCTSLAAFDLHHGRVEMGFTWLERPAWGQGLNEDLKRILLGYCFDTLGLARVELQVDARNERSRRALERMGFSFEGTLRSRHERPDGSRRDSLFFSMLRDEWPAAAERLSQLSRDRSTGAPPT